MTTVHAEMIGENALLARSDLERLIDIARRSEPVQLEMNESGSLTRAIMEVAAQGGAFDWLADEKDLYSVNDLKVRFR